MRSPLKAVVPLAPQALVLTPPAPLPAPQSPAAEPPSPDTPEGWTKPRQAAFLRALATGVGVRAAARGVGLSRQSAYKLRHRLSGEPFDVAWAAAYRRQYDALAEAMLDRAINGVEVPHFHKGELIHTSRRYDDRAAVALLALRGQLARVERSYDAEDEGYLPDDFAALVERVEYGDER